MLAVFIKANAQTSEESHHEQFGNNSIMLFTGYTMVPKGREGERENNLIVPTIGIDYIRHLNEKSFLGLYVDLELSNYFVETGDLDQLTGKNALAIVM